MPKTLTSVLITVALYCSAAFLFIQYHQAGLHRVPALLGGILVLAIASGMTICLLSHQREDHRQYGSLT